MGVRAKILSGFLILTIMLLVAGVWSIYELRNIGQSVHELLDQNYKSIRAAKTMIESLEREDSGVLLLLSGKWEEGQEIIESADKLFHHGFNIASHNVTIVGEREAVQGIAAAYGKYKGLWKDPIVGTPREGNLNWYFEEVHHAFLEVKARVNALMEMNDREMYKTASALQGRAHRAVMPGIVAIVSALAFTLIFNYFIHYYVAGPIVETTKAIQGFLDNGRPIVVKIETRDELAELVSSVRMLADRARGIGSDR
jgi:HAMP domain-containing protein